MLRLRRFLLIVVLVATVSVAGGVGRTINAEEPIPPAGVLAVSSQPEVSPAVIVPGGPGFYSQPAASFRPEQMSDQWAFSSQTLYNPGASEEFFESPVSLPNGTTINKIVFYFFDNSSTNDVLCALFRQSLDSPTSAQMALATSTGAQNTYRYMETTSILNPTIDLQSSTYIVVVDLPPDSNVRFLGYRIDYQYPGYLPTVMKNSN